MTLAACGTVFWPTPIHGGGDGAGGSSTLGANAATFDSTTDRLAWVGQSPISDSISKIYFRVGAIAATAGTGVQVRIETVANGKPTGTLWSANGTGAAPTASVTIADTDDNSWKTATLTNAAVLIPGDEFAIVIIYEAGNDDGTFSVPFQISSTFLSNLSGEYPLQWQDTGGGTYASTGNNACWEWIVEMTTAGVISLPGLLPQSGAGTLTAYSTGAAPDERALKFTAPFKARVIGVRVTLFNLVAASAFTCSLWDSTANGPDGQTPLAQSNSVDGDSVYATTADGHFDIYFTAPYTLTAGTAYYAGVRNTTANAISLGELTNSNVTNAMRAFGLGTTTAHLGTRTWTGTNPGAWTDTTTTLPLISLIIDQIDDGTGTGGGGAMVHRIP